MLSTRCENLQYLHKIHNSQQTFSSSGKGEGGRQRQHNNKKIPEKNISKSTNAKPQKMQYDFM